MIYVHACLLPPNTTDKLQPMDVHIIAKDYLKQRFEKWHASEVTKQLTGEDDIESVDLEHVDLCLAAVSKVVSGHG